MFVVTVPIPRCGSEAFCIKPKYTFRVPSLNQISQFGREVRPHIDYPSDLLGMAGASCQTGA